MPNFFIKLEFTFFWRGAYYTPTLNDSNLQFILLLVLNTLLILLSKSFMIFFIDFFTFAFIPLFFFILVLIILYLNFFWWISDKFSTIKIMLNIIYYIKIIQFLGKGDIFGVYLFLTILLLQILSYFDAKYDFLFIVINTLLLGILFGLWDYLESVLCSLPGESSSETFKKKIIATMFSPKDTRADRVAIWGVVGALFLQTTSVILNMAARRRVVVPTLLKETISGVSDVGAIIAGGAILKETYGMLNYSEPEIKPQELPKFINKIPSTPITHYLNGVSIKTNVVGFACPDDWIKITIIDFEGKNAGKPGWSMPFNGSWEYFGPRRKYLEKYLSGETFESID